MTMSTLPNLIPPFSSSQLWGKALGIILALLFLLLPQPGQTQVPLLGADLILQLGGSAYRTKMRGGERVRLDFGHVGYDLKLSYLNWPEFRPYLLLQGLKLFTSKEDLRSFRTRVGLGGQYLYNKKLNLSLEVIRTKTELLTSTSGGSKTDEEVVYFLNALASLWLMRVKGNDLRLIAGIGPHFPGSRKFLKLKIGDREVLGLRYELHDFIPEQHFLFQLLGEREVMRTNTFKQARYSLYLGVGKEI